MAARRKNGILASLCRGIVVRRSRAVSLFFTVILADRSSDLLVRHINRLRQVYTSVQERYPFETIAICVLPDHLHAVWSLPEGDANFPLRWSLIKSGFSRGLTGDGWRSASKIAKRDKEIWQRRYWEHAIRDDADLARHVDYIHFNRDSPNEPRTGVDGSDFLDWPEA
jgi:putative transposase